MARVADRTDQRSAVAIAELVAVSPIVLTGNDIISDRRTRCRLSAF